MFALVCVWHDKWLCLSHQTETLTITMFVYSQPKQKNNTPSKTYDCDIIAGHAQYCFVSAVLKKYLCYKVRNQSENKTVFSNAQKTDVKRSRQGAFLCVLELLLITCAVNDNPSAARLCNTWASASTNLRAVHDHIVLGWPLIVVGVQNLCIKAGSWICFSGQDLLDTLLILVI